MPRRTGPVRVPSARLAAAPRTRARPTGRPTRRATRAAPPPRESATGMGPRPRRARPGRALPTPAGRPLAAITRGVAGASKGAKTTRKKTPQRAYVHGVTPPGETRECCCATGDRPAGRTGVALRPPAPEGGPACAKGEDNVWRGPPVLPGARGPGPTPTSSAQPLVGAPPAAKNGKLPRLGPAERRSSPTPRRAAADR